MEKLQMLNPFGKKRQMLNQNPVIVWVLFRKYYDYSFFDIFNFHFSVYIVSFCYTESICLKTYNKHIFP